MVHDGVTDKDNLKNQAGINVRVFCYILGQCIDRIAHRPRHFAVPTWVHHGIADAAHQIFAKSDLWVHHTCACNHFARG